MALLIKNLEKKYGNYKVIDKLSFKCNKGEIVGLLGLNGAGKTTLIKILTGINTKWDGEITFNGLDLQKNIQKIQKVTGYLPEDNPLYSDLYVIEYLKFISNFYKTKDSQIKRVIDLTGLSNYKNKIIKTLSKGYKQRIGIAAAILHEPDFLILDEPTTGLDPHQLLEIRKLIKDIGKNKTVLFSTHILSEVKLTCNRVLLLHEGKIKLDSPIKKVKNLEKLFKDLSNK